ncbi:gamma-glutamylcyclotransferase family protein [Streptomyces anthocyanicus]|uniref:gamma-glutamylcyclotransferase family protein n=1 Tax=Streptomyces anthocyanicus TaxID=68174 RepID=UPI002F91BD08|nr:gamma-glutamylcyclotransferase [Streptomyces anthocyanicus]
MSLFVRHSLFTYGTLQMPEVQLARFGRLLHGRRDRLPGFRTMEILIADSEVIAVSGTDRHLLVVPSANPGDAVEGSVLRLTDEELSAADDYEVDDYTRVEVVLASGTKAWAYLASDRARDGENPSG